MVTVLDVSLLQSFSVIFPVLLVFAVVFALLQKTKALGDAPAINAIIAVAASLMVLLSNTITQMINFMIPWFVIVFLFFMLLLLVFRIFGANDKDIFGYMKNDKAVGWVIIAIGIIILFAAGGKVFGQSVGPYLEGQDDVNVTEGGSSVATGSFEANIWAIMFNPKVLGMGIIFVIIVFAVSLLTGKAPT